MEDTTGSGRLLITGGTGLLGGELVRRAAAGDRFEVTATRRASPPPPVSGVRWLDLDLGVPGVATRAIGLARPDVVIHTAVAIAPEALDPVIARGSEEIADAAAARGAALIHISSDMVFDGDSGPYDETAPLSPITDYGRAKAEAERRVLAAHPGAVVVRLSLLYRLDPPDRSLAAWLEGARAGAAYPLFTDEIRCPAEVGEVAEALERLAAHIGDRHPGRDAPVGRILHLVGPEAITRHAFGGLVLGALGMPSSLARPARSADSGLVRPRALHLLARTTPPSLLAGIRAPSVVLAPGRNRHPRAGR